MGRKGTISIQTAVGGFPFKNFVVSRNLASLEVREGRNDGHANSLRSLDLSRFHKISEKGRYHMGKSKVVGERTMMEMKA